MTAAISRTPLARTIAARPGPIGHGAEAWETVVDVLVVGDGPTALYGAYHTGVRGRELVDSLTAQATLVPGHSTDAR